MGRISLSFLKRRAVGKAAKRWKGHIFELDRGKQAFNLPRLNSNPKIRTALRNTSKAMASRFYQLLSGHALIAPFPKEKWKWTDSDSCWWCKRADKQEKIFEQSSATPVDSPAWATMPTGSQNATELKKLGVRAE